MSIRKTILLSVVLAALAGSANAITYNVSRTIGGGSVTGTIETDGKLGILSESNIVDWTLTLSSPNLRLGPTEVIRKSDPGSTTQVYGPALVATATQLTFDSDSPFAFIVQAFATGNGWCLMGRLVQCRPTTNPQEENIMFHSSNPPFESPLNVPFDPDILIVAESASRAGIQVVGTATAAVPLPAALPLLGAGLGVLGFVGIRRRRAI